MMKEKGNGEQRKLITTGDINTLQFNSILLTLLEGRVLLTDYGKS
jgi:hypothetical protein